MVRYVRFYRGVVAANGVMQSFCPRCAKLVAWSRERNLLRIAEHAHQCFRSEGADTKIVNDAQPDFRALAKCA